MDESDRDISRKVASMHMRFEIGNIPRAIFREASGKKHFYDITVSYPIVHPEDEEKDVEFLPQEEIGELVVDVEEEEVIECTPLDKINEEIKAIKENYKENQ